MTETPRRAPHPTAPDRSLLLTTNHHDNNGSHSTRHHSPASLHQKPIHTQQHQNTTHTSSQVLEDGGGIHGSGSSHTAIGSGAVLQQTVNTTDWELKSSTSGTRDWLLLITSSLHSNGTLGTLSRETLCSFSRHCCCFLQPASTAAQHHHMTLGNTTATVVSFKPFFF